MLRGRYGLFSLFPFGRFADRSSGFHRSAYFLFDNGGSFYMLMAKNVEVLVPFSGVHYIECTHIGVMLGISRGLLASVKRWQPLFFVKP